MQTQFGKYELKRPLGSGASGTVYCAFDTFQRREVALKVFDPNVLQDAQMGEVTRGQFMNEAALAGRLSHPHIVSIFEAVMAEDSGYVAMEYAEAIRVLESSKEKFEFPVAWGVDLQSEHERYLTEKYARKPVIVMNYPREIKAFYMRVNDDGRTVAAMDVLAPGIGEIVGGSQREERLDVLETRMKEYGLDCDAYRWYLDLRRYGTVPHAGFGLGFERTLAYVTGLSNVRDAIPFPRTPGNAKF